MQRTSKRGSLPWVGERGIRTPSENDVMSGRGKSVHYHWGNVQFLMLVKQSRRSYVLAPKHEKGKFAVDIVAEINAMDPPGRFLIRDPESGFWNEMNRIDSVNRTRQCLREGAPKLLKELKRENLMEHRKQKDTHEEAVQGNMIDASTVVPTNPHDEVIPLVPIAPLPRSPSSVLLQHQHHQHLSPFAPQVDPNPTTRESSRSESHPETAMYHHPADSNVEDMCRRAKDELMFRKMHLQRLGIEARIAEERIRLSLAQQQVQYLRRLNNMVHPMARFDLDGHRRNANNTNTGLVAVAGNEQRRRASYVEHPFTTNLQDPVQGNQDGMYDVSDNDDLMSSIIPYDCRS
eukprot:scaffold249608_cov47-Attheya_sp.AAC.1